MDFFRNTWASERTTKGAVQSTDFLLAITVNLAHKLVRNRLTVQPLFILWETRFKIFTFTVQQF
ncbi:hypothetical protein DC498_19530 [Terrimonas sp.]|nr:hypothetical protein DC498_19530 [Terrimonas sp.]